MGGFGDREGGWAGGLLAGTVTSCPKLARDSFCAHNSESSRSVERGDMRRVGVSNSAFGFDCGSDLDPCDVVLFFFN